MYDIVINGGTIFDPKTRIETIGNIGISEGVIKDISREKMEGKKIIDAKKKVVCPGFIDIHSHINFPIEPAWMSVRQGITTCLSGNCGLTPHLPISEYLDKIESQGYPLNFAMLVGHSWKLREMVGLSDIKQAADKDQMKQMVKLAEQALKDGAFGISFGIEYAPGTSDDECLSLVELAAKYDKLVTVHTRAGALDFAEGLYQVISWIEKTGVRVQVSHLIYMFGLHPHTMDMALSMINDAYERGLPILCDSGMYEAFATYVQSNAFDEGWYNWYQGELSDLMISSGKYKGMRATQEIYEDVRNNERDTVGTAFVGREPDVIKAILQPYTMISTDAGLVDAPGEGHPQDSGTFPKVFEKLVRKQGVLSMMDAVYKCTYMPAVQMGIEKNKGWLGTGADADIVIFNPRTIRSNSDYVGIGEPDAPPSGIEYVIVNGKCAVEDSKENRDVLAGKVLRQANGVWHM